MEKRSKIEVSSYWIDMESSLRNEADEFDLDIVTTILEIAEKLLKVIAVR